MIIAMLVPLAVGCAKPTPAAPPATPTVVGPPAPKGNVTTLVFDDPPFWRDQASRGNINYEVVGYNSLHDHVLRLLVANTPLNIIHIHQGWLREWGGTKGWLLPLDWFLASSDAKDFPANALDQLTAIGSDGQKHLYGIPLYLWLSSLYYNDALLKQAGVSEPPKTWSELRLVAKTVKEKTGRFGFVSAFAGGSATGVFAVVLRGEGGEILTAEGKPSFNTEAGKRALSQLVGLAQDGTMDPTSYTLDNASKAIDLFVTGSSAMGLLPPPTFPQAADPNKSKVVGQIRVALVPGGSVYRSASTCEVGSRAIAASSTDPGAAWEGVQFLTSAAEVKRMAIEIGRVPVRLSVLNDPEVVSKYPLCSIIGEQLQYPTGVPILHERGTELGRVLNNYIVAAMRNEKTVDQALAEAEAEVNAILAQ